MKKNILTSVLVVLLIAVGIYSVNLRNRLTEDKIKIARYSRTIDSLQNEIKNRADKEESSLALSQVILEKAKNEAEQAEKKSK